MTVYQAFEIKKVWTFLSESNPNKKYETLLYSDDSTSCNCPGWTRRFKKGVRSCKHIRMVDMGTADQECTNSHDYAKAKEENADVYQTLSAVSKVVNQLIFKAKPKPVKAPPKMVKAPKPVENTDVENMELSIPIVRKIQW